MSLRGGRGTRVLVLLLLYIGMFITTYQCLVLFISASLKPYAGRTALSPPALCRACLQHILHARMHARLKN